MLLFILFIISTYSATLSSAHWAGIDVTLSKSHSIPSLISLFGCWSIDVTLLMSLFWNHFVDVTLWTKIHVIERHLHCKEWLMHQRIWQNNSACLASNIHLKPQILSYLTCWYCQQGQALHTGLYALSSGLSCFFIKLASQVQCLTAVFSWDRLRQTKKVYLPTSFWSFNFFNMVCVIMSIFIGFLFRSSTVDIEQINQQTHGSSLGTYTVAITASPLHCVSSPHISQLPL